MGQNTLRPNADVNTGGWTTESNGSSTLYAQVDETSASDADYIRSPDAPASSLVEFALTNPTGVAKGQAGQLDFRYGALDSNNIFLIARIQQGSASTIASWYYPESYSSVLPFAEVVTTAMVSGITDPNDLRLQFEAQHPSLDIDLVRDRALDSRFTFTRGSNATYVNSSGLVTTASANVARLDYDPASLIFKGLLIEESRTNLLLASEAFNDGNWGLVNATVETSTGVTAPEGSVLTADKISDDTAVGVRHIIYQAYTTSASTIYTGSVFLKNGTRRYAQIGNGADGASNFYGIILDLQTGLVTDTKSVGSANGTYSVTNFGNGWYRVTITVFTTGTTTYFQVGLSNSATPSYDAFSNPAYTGNGSYIYLWGAQAELGSFATSYIQTVLAQVTRSADDITALSSTQISPFYNSSQGTLFAEVQHGGGTNNAVCGFYGNGAFDYLALLDSGGGPVGLVSRTESDGSTIAAITSTRTEDIYRLAAGFANDDYAVYYNGMFTGTDSVGALRTTIDRFYVGNSPFGDQQLRGWLKRIRYWPRRLPNAYLQALTEPQPTLDFNFRTRTLDPRLTFTRASNATYVTTSGIVATASANVARFDHDPVTGLCKGLLIEESRTNLATFSAQMDNGSVWLDAGITSVSTATVAAPDNTNTAWTFTALTTGYISIRNTIAVSPSTTYIFSYWINANSSANGIRVRDITNGADIIDVGDVIPIPTSGWARVTNSFTTPAGCTSVWVYIINESATSGSTWTLWGAQVEAGVFATSYIHTVSTQVTRSADSITALTSTQISGLYNTSTGTLFAEVQHGGGNNNVICGFFGTGGNDRVAQLHDSIGASTVDAFYRSALVANADIFGTRTEDFYRLVTAYATDDFVAYYNGTSLGTATGTVPHNIDSFYVGNSPQGDQWLNGWLKRIRYWPQRLTNAKLITLTS